ncbi:Cysteine protease atg4d [Bulinus truncatus]|nr:Cysteine protease atg4d [Bulinus truncatus]
MNFSSSRDRYKGGSVNLDDNRKAPTDDVLSLNSWSDKLNLSTSSSNSSESSLRQAMTFVPKETQKQEMSPKDYSRKGSVLQDLKYNSSVDENGRKGRSVPSCASITSYELDYSSQLEPDFSFINNSDIDEVDSPFKKVSDIFTVHDSLHSKKVTGQNRNNYDSKEHGLYPRLLFYSKNESLEVTDHKNLKINSSQSETKSENKQDFQQNTRPRFFDYHRNPSSTLLVKNIPHHENHSSGFSSLPTSLLPTENSSSQLSSHASSRLERNAIQGKATTMDRLHSSQPQLATFAKKPTKLSTDLESYKQSREHKLEPNKMKMKFTSTWNNIKYGLRPHFGLTNMKCDSPLYLLGRCYHRRKNDAVTDPSSEEEFSKDFFSRIWLTYRINFYPIPGTTLCSDCGWGCMLRSGQMLIAQCLLTHFLTRDWRLHDSQNETQRAFYREIIRWFSEPIDAPSDKNPFCLHHLADFGRVHHKDPGQWYGPSSVAYIFRDVFSHAYKTVPILSQLCIYVAQDCTVYIDDVLKLCTAKNRSESVSSSFESSHDGASSTAAVAEAASDVWLRSLIILIPMRLGGEAINEIYIPCIKSLLSHSNCMGIIGGKPKHSLYFLGWQDDKLIYLDPHLCHDAIDTSEPNFKIESFHCSTPRKMSITKMDPSCTVGFYIRNAQEFQKFVYEVREFISPAKQRGIYPLFIFTEGSHEDSSNQHYSGGDKGRVKITHYHIDENGQRKRTFSHDSEEFVML